MTSDGYQNLSRAPFYENLKNDQRIFPQKE